MHGLVNRSIQCFVTDTYGVDVWARIAASAGLPDGGFEAVLTYDDALTDRTLDAASRALDKCPREMLEDLGTYLASNPTVEAVRRLLRFSGTTYVEFLLSLEDLRGRARLALPDLDMPDLEVCQDTPGSFVLTARWVRPDVGHVLVGVLRAMADDYGALVLLEHEGETDGAARIRISLLDTDFAMGRDFSLAGAAA